MGAACVTFSPQSGQERSRVCRPHDRQYCRRARTTRPQLRVISAWAPSSAALDTASLTEVQIDSASG